MDIRNDSCNPRLIPGIILFFFMDVLLIVQIISHKDFLVKYNTKCLLIIGSVSFVLSLIGNLFAKKKYEKIFGLILIFVFILFFALLFVNCKVVYGVL